MEETKICSKCGRELSLSEFHKAKSCKNGYRNVCKECEKQYMKQYRQEHKEEILEHAKQYRQDNKEHYAEYNKQYKQEHKEHYAEYMKQYYQDNKEYYAEYKKQYQKQYRQTPMGRALCLANGHRQHDKQYNRGECTLTAQWIVENIFTKSCHWCGETDWHKLGCDRIDNDKPHTPDNVNPCCEDCNKKRGNKTYEEFLELIKKEKDYASA